MLKVVERANRALMSGDYDLLVSNLIALQQYLKIRTPDAAEKNEIEAAIDDLKFVVEAYKTRREDVETQTVEYEKRQKQIEAYDFYTNAMGYILSSPDASTYMYDTAMPSEPHKQRLKAYFEAVSARCGVTIYSGMTLSQLKAEVNKIEREMDACAFAINKANGVYDERVVADDKVLLDKYELQQQLRNSQPDGIKLYEEIFVGKIIDQKQILDNEILAAASNSTLKADLEAIRDGRAALLSIPDNIRALITYADGKDLSISDINNQLNDVKSRIAAAGPSPVNADQLLQEQLTKILAYVNSKKQLQTNNRAIYDKVFEEPKKPGGKAAIERAISALESRRRTTAQERQLQVLRDLLNSKAFTRIETHNFNELFTKYGITSGSIDDLRTLLESPQEIADPANHSSNDYAPSTLRERVSNSATSKDNPRIVMREYPASPENGQNVQDLVTTLHQEHGYFPIVGRQSFVYARPVYRKVLGIQTRTVESMQIVEESIESIAKDPVEAYRQALKEAKKKYEAIYGTKGPKADEFDINIMKKEFEKLVIDGKMDEAIKRIISVKCSNSRDQLDAIKDTHGKGNASINFLGDDQDYYEYDAPKVTAQETPVLSHIFKTYKKFTIDEETPSTTAHKTTPKNFRYSFGNRGTGPVVSRNIVHDRTHHKDDRDER